MVDLTRAVADQADRVGGEHGVERQVARGGHAERRHAIGVLAVDPQRLPARREQHDARARAQERAGQLRGRLDEMLAIVEHEQDRAVGQVLDQAIERGPARILAQPERGAGRRSDMLGGGQRRELDQPDAVARAVEQLGRGLQRESRLAGAAGAGQRHEPRAPQQVRDVGDLALAPDQRARLLGQVVAQARIAERAQRREVLVQARCQELEHMLGTAEVLQPVLAQVAQPRLLAGELGDHSAQEHLAAVPGGEQPRDAVDRRPEEVAVALLALAQVHRHPHTQPRRVGPRLGRERRLPGARGRDGVPRAGERRAEGIADGLDHAPAMLLDDTAQELVVARQRRRHRGGVALPQPRAALDVGEQQCDRRVHATDVIRARPLKRPSGATGA